MPLNESLNYRFPEHRNTTTFKGLPGMLADVLPDKYGNALINQWLVKQTGRPIALTPLKPCASLVKSDGRIGV